MPLEPAPTTALAVPGGHGTQVLALDAPSTVEYVPAAHAAHVPLLLAPAFPEYVPGAQATHAASLLAFGVVEKVPCGHGVHAVAPGAAYDPRAHGTQSLSEVWPARGCLVPPGHARQSLAAAAPCSGW